MTIMHRAWRKLRGTIAALTSGQDEHAAESRSFKNGEPDHDLPPRQDEYATRYAEELKSFDNCETVHDLPLIFHYWSHTYLAPKLAPFGITDPEQFFFLYAQKFHARFPAASIRMVSIGSGNCDMEVRMAQRLVENGITAFTIECMDINKIMLERGRNLAATAGLSRHVVPITGDFNYWKPNGVYDLVMANQCLHHVVELENLFAAIKSCLNPEGYFLASDMIGRNGHLRWPEALKIVDEFWQELPDSYRYNRLLSRHEPQFINHDCSSEGFEGIRAQDILQLLVHNFKFELFIPFANVVYVFIDRPFGPNFNHNGEWDKNFVDRLHARDEEGMLNGELKPTQMLAVLRTVDIETQLLHPKLTPQFCVRRTDV